MKNLVYGTSIAIAMLWPATALAHEDDKTAPHAMNHAPIGVMADHRHRKGEWMLSYRYMTMEMEGNRDGTTSLSADQIVSETPNRFFGSPMQPPTLRVVPESMQMDMHMVGAMYGLSDRVTLMGMTSYVSREMDHVTYQGGMGTTVLGNFTTKSDGQGDSSIGAIIGLGAGFEKASQVNLNLGLTLPTGSIKQTDQILTPMGTTPSPRLPYPMQLGTGTFDIKAGLSYLDRNGPVGWGAQANSRIPTAKNDEGYAFGNSFDATAWLSYEPAYWISMSGRVEARTQGDIKGIDSLIAAPVQTADSDNFGGQSLTVFGGVNMVGQTGALRGHRLAFEVGVPVYRDLNGPQLETDLIFTAGWQKAF